MTAISEIDNLLARIEGVNDERDSVPLLLGIRRRWPAAKGELADAVLNDVADWLTLASAHRTKEQLLSMVEASLRPKIEKEHG